ncbi:MAG: hypothetical protein ACRDY1_09880, partial [Acidimicrobiales bacterium]
MRPRGAAAVGTAGLMLIGLAAGVALTSVPSASATALSVTCTSLSGNLSSSPITFTLGGCSGNTGGGERPRGTPSP